MSDSFRLYEAIRNEMSNNCFRYIGKIPIGTTLDGNLVKFDIDNYSNLYCLFKKDVNSSVLRIIDKNRNFNDSLFPVKDFCFNNDDCLLLLNDGSGILSLKSNSRFNIDWLLKDFNIESIIKGNDENIYFIEKSGVYQFDSNISLVDQINLNLSNVKMNVNINSEMFYINLDKNSLIKVNSEKSFNKKLDDEVISCFSYSDVSSFLITKNDQYKINRIDNYSGNIINKDTLTNFFKRNNVLFDHNEYFFEPIDIIVKEYNYNTRIYIIGLVDYFYKNNVYSNYEAFAFLFDKHDRYKKEYSRLKRKFKDASRHEVKELILI